jgi:hypothetical protein
MRGASFSESASFPSRLCELDWFRQKISALGIEFSQTDQKSLLSILALITLYFLVAFILYAGSDFVAWRLAHMQAIKQWASAREAFRADEEERRREREAIYRRFAGRSIYVSPLGGPVSFLRAMFEFLLPILVGIYATLLLLKAPPPLQQEHQNVPVIVLPHDTMNMNSDAPIHLFP